MRFVTLASGSSGNCTYITDGEKGILVDAGIPCRRIEAELADLGQNPADILAVLVTHEHSDHVAGVRTLARKYGIPVLANEPTLRAMFSLKVLEKVPCELIRSFHTGSSFRLGNFSVLSYPIPHDCAEPVGYVISEGDRRMAIGTDLGFVSEAVAEALTGVRTLLLESNHDVEMLMAGRYPYPLKRRILGERGHLSNEAAADFAVELARRGTKQIVLGHLSEENNLPELALKTVQSRLDAEGMDCCRLTVAPRLTHGTFMEV